MAEIGLVHFLVVSSLVFGLGAAIVMTRRNAVAVLMGVEMILNAAALNFVAFGRYIENQDILTNARGAATAGQTVALFIVVAAAAEAAIALAIVLNFFNRYQTIHLDEGSELKQ
ncbi:MAG TPA: NADH-quinone oxidoreductase subunit NuoK [Planctomycetota bacterium]|nr:NADH-quinone oxidoreductase subunit NuoK [Planctomycetota bacterium]